MENLLILRIFPELLDVSNPIIMNNYLQGFKQDLFNTIMDLSGKSFLKILIAYTLTSIAMFSIMWLVFTIGLGTNPFTIETMSDPEALRNFFESMDTSSLGSNFIFTIILYLVIMMILASWSYNFFFIIIDQYIHEGNSLLLNAFNKSLDKSVFRIFYANILLILMFMAGAYIGGSLNSISGFLSFIWVLALFIFLLKFTLAIPAIAAGKLSVSEAFGYSFNNITWGRAIKLFLILIVAGVGLLILGMILGVISLALAAIPSVGTVIQYLIQLIIGGFITSFLVAGTIGLYYRYITEEAEDETVVINSPE